MASISSTSSTSSTSYNRITGLATGMDTDGMVKQAMQAYKLKVDQAKQARDLQVFKQTLYRDSIKSLRELFSKYTDIAKPDSMLLTKNYSTSKFTSTNENAVTAEGLAGAKIGNYKVQVNKLAEAGRIEVDSILALKGQTINVDVNGTKVDIDLTDATLTESDIVTKINAQMKNAGVSAKVSRSDLSGKLIFETTSTGSGQKITVSGLNKTQTNTMSLDFEDIKNQTLSFNLNNSGSPITVDLNDIQTTEAVVDKLNEALGSSNVKAEVSESGEIVLTATFKMGEDTNLFEVSYGEPETTVGGVNGDITQESLADTGSKVNVTITDSYGNTATKEYDSNTFTIDNVKFTVTDVTTEAVSIVGKNDASALKDKLVGFVNDYNKVIADITTKLNEKKDLNYKPLTDEQRESMTDDQIEKWEAKVKQGLLKRDNDLTQITSDLRRAFTDSIEGTGLTLKQLGIDFSSDISKAGQLVVDEEKLTSALEENADEIVNLFAKSAPSTMTDKEDIYDNSGIFQRIKTILNTSVMSSSSTLLKKVGYEGTSTYSNNDITNDLLKREKQIAYMESSLTDRETRLYQKFATLETVMNNYNAQSSWLTQQFSS